MKYRGTLVVVKSCAKALEFYKNVLGLELIQDNDGNMELSGGIYLQEECNKILTLYLKRCHNHSKMI